MKVNAIMEQLDESDGNGHYRGNNQSLSTDFMNQTMRQTFSTGQNQYPKKSTKLKG